MRWTTPEFVLVSRPLIHCRLFMPDARKSLKFKTFHWLYYFFGHFWRGKKTFYTRFLGHVINNRYATYCDCPHRQSLYYRPNLGVRYKIVQIQSSCYIPRYRIYHCPLTLHVLKIQLFINRCLGAVHQFKLMCGSTFIFLFTCTQLSFYIYTCFTHNPHSRSVSLTSQLSNGQAQKRTRFEVFTALFSDFFWLPTSLFMKTQGSFHSKHYVMISTEIILIHC